MSISTFDRFNNSSNELANEIVNEFRKFDLTHAGNNPNIIQDYADLINLISDKHISIHELSQLSVEYLFSELNIIPGNIDDSNNVIVVQCNELSFPYRIVYQEGTSQKDILVSMCQKAIELITCLSVVKSLNK